MLIFYVCEDRNLKQRLHHALPKITKYRPSTPEGTTYRYSKRRKLGFESRFISFKNVIDAKNFLAIFEKQQLHYQQALENQVNANKRYQQIIYNARLYISHFIQVFNLSVIRGDIKKEINFSINWTRSAQMSRPSTENDLLHWGNASLTENMSASAMAACQYTIPLLRR